MNNVKDEAMKTAIIRQARRRWEMQKLLLSRHQPLDVFVYIFLCACMRHSAQLLAQSYLLQSKRQELNKRKRAYSVQYFYEPTAVNTSVVNFEKAQRKDEKFALSHMEMPADIFTHEHRHRFTRLLTSKLSEKTSNLAWRTKLLYACVDIYFQVYVLKTTL